LGAVPTTKPGAWARQIVEHLGLTAELPLGLGEDDVGRRKPDPALIFEVCQRLGVAPAHTLFVGDSLIDMRTAQAAGVDLALCLYGYLDPETRRAVAAAAPPCPVARTLERLPDLLDPLRE